MLGHHRQWDPRSGPTTLENVLLYNRAEYTATSCRLPITADSARPHLLFPPFPAPPSPGVYSSSQILAHGFADGFKDLREGYDG